MANDWSQVERVAYGYFRCTECGFEGHSDDWPSKCFYHGSREEPPEWEAWCPDCGSSWEYSEEITDD